MILEKETFEAFGYYPKDLKPKSNKRILAACGECGKVRITSKDAYRALCKSCCQEGDKNHNFGIPLTEEHKRNIRKYRANLKGDKASNWRGGRIKRLCLQCGKEFKVAQSQIEYDMGKYCSRSCAAKARKGDKNSNYNGGKKAAKARSHAKRDREFGYTILMPLVEGEVGHHVTNEYVIGIPAEVHNSIGGRRKKHRTKVLQWLKENDIEKYKMILCILNK